MGWLCGVLLFCAGCVVGGFMGIAAMCLVIVGGGHGKRD